MIEEKKRFIYNKVCNFMKRHKGQKMLMVIMLCHSDGIYLPDGTEVADVIAEIGLNKNPIKVRGLLR
mgnify:CR=1 FL=1